MQLDVYTKYEKLKDNRISNSTVIVVDVLRSSTSIIWAVKNGAKVVPAADPGEASGIASRISSPDCILAGEKNGEKIPDYALGNSPEEFTPDKIRAKTIIFSTSNGTVAIDGAKGAKNLLIGSMINSAACAKRALELGNDIILLCAGTDGEISASNLVAAGSIAASLVKNSITPITESDISIVCRSLYGSYMNGSLDLSATKHWSKLVSLDMSSDVRFCFNANITDTVPEYFNGIIE